MTKIHNSNSRNITDCLFIDYSNFLVIDDWNLIIEK